MWYCALFFQDQRFANKEGAVRHVTGDTCSVFIYSERDTIPVRVNCLELVTPAKKDRVWTFLQIFLFQLHFLKYFTPPHTHPYSTPLLFYPSRHNLDPPLLLYWPCLGTVFSWAWFHYLIRDLLQVKILAGDDKEATGLLINIDGPDGIIKMDRAEHGLKILQLHLLAKFVPTD